MRHLTLFWACLLLGSLTGCAVFKQPSEQEKNNVSEMTTHMRTWALGRGLIDLPANWSGGGDVKLYYGLGADHSSVEVRVLGEGVTQERFDAALEERARRIAVQYPPCVPRPTSQRVPPAARQPPAQLEPQEQATRA